MLANLLDESATHEGLVQDVNDIGGQYRPEDEAEYHTVSMSLCKKRARRVYLIQPSMVALIRLERR